MLLRFAPGKVLPKLDHDNLRNQPRIPRPLKNVTLFQTHLSPPVALLTSSTHVGRTDSYALMDPQDQASLEQVVRDVVKERETHEVCLESAKKDGRPTC